MSPYNPATWSASVEHFDSRQAAFSQTQLKAAKKNVAIDDVLLCYIIGQKEVVAALRIRSEAYLRSQDKVLSLLFFPVRFKTAVIARVPLGAGVSLADIKANSGQPKTWISLVQGALKRVPVDDAHWIVAELTRRGDAL